jgi:hypothetical protein
MNEGVKKVNKPRVDKFPRRGGRAILFAIVIIFGLYVIGIMNPITGPNLRYPYYELYCGHKPILASSFMGKGYYTPDMLGYRVSMYSTFYCTEEAAQRDGYPKSMSPAQ